MAKVKTQASSSSAPTNKRIMEADYKKWQASPMIRDEVKQKLAEIYHDPKRDFDSKGFKKRVEISQRCKPNVYYRKVSKAEYDAIQKNQSGQAKGKAKGKGKGKGKGNDQPNPFESTFKHVNTDNYRYWISSSESKVREFGNENATEQESLILRLTFDADLRQKGNHTVAPHQAPEVQSNSKVVAMHREGFAELGNMNKPSQVEEIVKGDLDHNLGFTDQHLGFLAEHCTHYELV